MKMAAMNLRPWTSLPVERSDQITAAEKIGGIWTPAACKNQHQMEIARSQEKKRWPTESSAAWHKLHLEAREKPRSLSLNSVGVLLCIRRHPKQLILWGEMLLQINFGHGRGTALCLTICHAECRERFPSGESLQERVSETIGLGVRSQRRG